MYLWTIAGVCTGEWWHRGGGTKQTLLFRGIPDLYLYLRSYYSPLFSLFCHEMNGLLLTDLLSQILSTHCRRSPSPSLHPPLLQSTNTSCVHCGFAPLFLKHMAHECDPDQNTIKTERNHATGGGGGGGYAGRRVDETMPVIHAEVLLGATPLDLESCLFFCAAVETGRVLVSCAAR